MKTYLRTASLALVAILAGCTAADVGLGYNPTTGQINVGVSIRDGKAVVAQPVKVTPGPDKGGADRAGKLP